MGENHYIEVLCNNEPQCVECSFLGVPSRQDLHQSPARALSNHSPNRLQMLAVYSRPSEKNTTIISMCVRFLSQPGYSDPSPVSIYLSSKFILDHQNGAI